MFFGGLLGGDQGARPLACFDDQDAKRQGGDNAIAPGEVLAIGRRVHGELGDHRSRSAGARDFLEEFGVFGRVDVRKSAAQDGQGAAVAHERGAMGGGIDAAGAAGDDGDSCPGECARETGGLFQPVGGAAAAADDGEREAIGRSQVALVIKDGGRIRNGLEKCGI